MDTSKPLRDRLNRAVPSVGIGIALAATNAVAAPAQAQAPAAPTPTALPRTTTEHVVVAGDTVSGLAARYGSAVAAIVQENGLDSRATIRIGQRLRIPLGTTQTSATPSPTTTTTTNRTHTVVRGDTVSGLAAKHGTTVAEIVAANGLDSRALIRVGQRLTIPGARSSSSSPAQQLVGSTFLGRTYPAATVASANQNKAALLAIEVPSRAEMQELVRKVALEMGVDPALALAVAYQESGFDQRAVSPANAIGTMQVIPSSGEWAATLVGHSIDLRDPLDNVTAGVAILRQLLRSAPDLPTAIASYYQGLGSVRRNGMYADTRRYVANVQTLMTRFR